MRVWVWTDVNQDRGTMVKVGTALGLLASAIKPIVCSCGLGGWPASTGTLQGSFDAGPPPSYQPGCKGRCGVSKVEDTRGMWSNTGCMK